MNPLSVRLLSFGLLLMAWISLMLPSQAVAAETPPEFAWAISAGGPQHDKTRGIAVDAAGNIFMTGEFTATAEFGEFQLTSAGSMDCFVAKVSPEGQFLWVRSGGGELIDRGYAVTTDPAGNCYVTGHYQSPQCRFGDTTITNTGDYDLFIAKYNTDGELQWIKSGGGDGYDYGHGIAADGSGNLFVTGAIRGQGQFNGHSLGAPGPARVFCLGLDHDGNMRWSHVATGSGSSSGHAIAADQQGNCYLGGNAAGVSTLAGHSIGQAGARDVLVARFNSAGKLDWVYSGHGSPSAMIHEITVDNTGRVWASGMYQQDLKLADRTVANHGRHDLLLTSFDTSGRRLWTKTAGGPNIDYGLGIATDGSGNSILTGSFAGEVDFEGTPRRSRGNGADIPIVKFNPSGQLLWYLQAGGDRTNHAYTIVSDHLGNLYLSGACSDPAEFGSHSISHRGSNDIFLAKLTPR